MDVASRYRVVRRLGRGGMAEVLEAFASGASGFERRVAIKRMLPASTGSDTLVRMFLDEARTASHLHHANIVAVLDFGVLEGVPFQVLEFVDGLDAFQMSERPLPPALALYVCTEIGHALEHAHQARDASGKALGIVHRDVKPSNILVSWSGEVKLGDFGVAFARDRIESTLDGSVKGTPLFMAPEQMVRGRIDPRTDLFALGCVLHFFLTGESPLAGGRALADLMAGAELPLERIADPEVRGIVAKAVRRDLTQRYASAAEMTRALGSALAGRLKVDAKSLLRDWLSPQGAAAAKPPAGRLDELLNLEIVPSAQEHVFVSRVIDPTVVTQASAGRTRRWLAVLGVGAVLAAAALLVGRTRTPVPAPQPTLPPAAPVLARPEPPPSVPEPAPQPQSKVPVTVSLQHGSRQAPKGHAPAPGLNRVGAVAFGGSEWVGSEVLLDGRSLGYAPKVVDIPVGKHSVDLIAPNGRHSGPGTLRVTARHTPLSPLHYPAEH